MGNDDSWVAVVDVCRGSLVRARVWARGRSKVILLHMPPCPSNISSSLTPSNVTIPDASHSFSPAPLQSFSLQAVTESEGLKELPKLDPKKTSGSDGLDPFFFNS